MWVTKQLTLQYVKNRILGAFFTIYGCKHIMECVYAYMVYVIKQPVG